MRLPLRGWLALSAMALVAGCSVLQKSDRSFVANSAAERIYQEDRYERLCVAVKGPPTCLQMQAAVNALKHANEVANTVQQLGTVPAPERKEIAALLATIRSLP